VVFFQDERVEEGPGQLLDLRAHECNDYEDATLVDVCVVPQAAPMQPKHLQHRSAEGPENI
jgi:hypothetical protein